MCVFNSLRYLLTGVEVSSDKRLVTACVNDHVLKMAVEKGKTDIAGWAQGRGEATLSYIASFLSVQETNRPF